MYREFLNNSKIANFRDNHQRLAEKIYFLALGIYLIGSYITGTMFDYSDQVLLGFNLIAASLMLIKIVFFDYSEVKDIVLILLVLMLFYLTGRYAQDYQLYYYAYFIIASKNIEYKKIIKFFVMLISILLLVTIACSLFDIIPNVKIGRDNEATLRFALGTIYPTDLAARVFYLMLTLVTLKKFNLKIQEYIIFISLTAMTYFITDTKLDALLMVLVLVVAMIKKYIINLFNYIKPLYLNLLIAIFVFGNVVMPYIYTPTIGILQKIDHALSGRLYYGHVAFKDYNITVFGQYIFQNGWGGGRKVTDYFFIDSSYLRMLMMLGLVMFIIMLGAILYLSKKFLENKQYSLLIMLGLVLLSSAIDQHFIELTFNTILLTLTANTDYFKEK